MSINTSEFTDTLTRITAGGQGAAALEKLNKPLGEIETALNELASRIGDNSSDTSLIRRYAPLSPDAFVGALVYYNSAAEHCRFEPAKAELLGIPGSQGESVEAPCARVEGMVIAVDSDSLNSDHVTGTLLCGGSYTDASAVTGCMGSSPLSGTYYLSPDSPGHAVMDPGISLRQPVLSYYGNNCFNLSLFYMAHDGHHHASHILGDYWKPISELPSDISSPQNATYWYDVSEDAQMNDMGDLATGITAIFLNGELQHPATGTVTVHDGMLWSSQVVGTSDSVILFNHFPFAYGDAVIRNIVSLDGDISVNIHNGTATLSTGNFEVDQTAPSSTAISRISKRSLGVTPVVSGILQGPGIKLTSYPKGRVMVSSASIVETNIDAYDVNHNGTNMTSDSNFLYFTFPAKRQSSMMITLPVSLGTSMDADLYASVWGCCVSGQASFDVDMYWIPMPSEGETTSMPSRPTATGILSFNGTQTGLSYRETSGRMLVGQDGLMAAYISINGAPQYDVRLLRLGFKLYTTRN